MKDEEENIIPNEGDHKNPQDIPENESEGDRKSVV
jgi:hypothetical protein